MAVRAGILPAPGSSGIARLPQRLGPVRRLVPRWRSAQVVRTASMLRAALLIERDRLALWLPVCVGAGDATYFAWRTEPARWPAIGLVLTCLAVLGLARRSEAWRVAAAAVLAVATGFLAAGLATDRAPPMPDLPRVASIVSGRIGAVESFADGTRRVTFERPAIDGDPPMLRHLRVRLRADDVQAVAVGGVITLRAMLRAPAPPGRAMPSMAAPAAPASRAASRAGGRACARRSRPASWRPCPGRAAPSPRRC